MFAVLGDVPFQVVGSPQTLSDSRGYDYAEHRVVQARPQLQWLADDLMRIQLEMLLHQSFTDPAVSLFTLTQAASTHAALPLIFGNGDFRGYFVVTEIATQSRQLSGSGDIYAVIVRLSLRESPVSFDPTAPPVPNFLPLAIASITAAGSASSPTGISSGVSALAAPPPASGPSSALLLPDDVPPSVIVRSAA